MVSVSSPTKSGETEGEIVGAIEELVAEFGVRGVVTAALNSTLGPQLNKVGGGDAALRISQVILREIVFSKDPQLQAEVMAVGAGIILEDDVTITRLAAKHGITKQAFSKRVVSFCEEMGLPPSQYMRAEKDRATYALTNQPRTA